jgi:NADPH:quinone reductase-like Zn-dependent oxidoreductase
LLHLVTPTAQRIHDRIDHTPLRLPADPNAFVKAKKYVFDHLVSGNFKPRIDKTFPLRDIVSAHRYMESNAQIGKIVVTV